ncbi:MAG: T9SS type A sorting domain-containing protein [Bacteroidetes bacterium]|nr:T9SS type A sorting domain-containing protein [Bacteroidota bacterium]
MKTSVRISFLVLFILFCNSKAKGQLNYSFIASSLGSYTYNNAPTQIMGPLVDEALSAPVPIGFTFVYGGTNYTQLRVSSNGWMTFDLANTLTYPLNDLSSAPVRTVLAPLWDDLRTSTIGNVNYQLVPDPNAVGKNIFSLEWKLMNWNHTSNQDVISMQVKLYENGNYIEFIYRSEGFNPIKGSASIGISGSCLEDYYALDDVSLNPIVLKTNENNLIDIKPQSAQVYTFSPIVNMLPTNDLCASARVIPYNIAFCTTTSGTLIGATATGSPAAPACWSPASSENDVWYFVTKPAGQTTMLVSVDNIVSSCSPFSTELAVYSGTCAALSLVGCASTGGNLNTQNAVLTLAGLPAAATGYYIRVEGDALTTGNFQICVKSTNDECNGATLLTPNYTCNYFYTTSVGSTNSTTTPIPTIASGYSASSLDVWFKFIATSNYLIVDTKDLTMLDGAIAIYRGADCLSLDALTPTTFPNPNPFDDNLSNNGKMPRIVRNDFIVGVTYFVRLWANTVPLSGTFGICVSERKYCSFNAADTCTFAPTIGLGTFCGDNTQSRITQVANPLFPVDTQDPIAPMYCTTPLSSNPTIDNVVYYRFLTNAAGGNVVLNVYNQVCMKDFGLQVALFKPTVPCAGGANWGKALSPCYNSLKDLSNDKESDPKPFSLSFTALLPNTFYYLLFDGSSIDKCTWDLTLTGSVTLPIELLQFKGVNKGDYNLITWTTKTEINNDYFTVERSSNAQDFEPLFRINGGGNTNYEINYSIKDFDPIDGVNYYRLRQTDFNGEYHYSDVISVNSESNNVLQITSVFPNPAENLININIFAQKEITAEFLIYDLYGKMLTTKQILLQEGENSLQQELNEYTPGLYFITIQVPQKNKQYNSKFLKMR